MPASFVRHNSLEFSEWTILNKNLQLKQIFFLKRYGAVGSGSRAGTIIPIRPVPDPDPHSTGK
jgi:hypothetical protein